MEQNDDDASLSGIYLEPWRMLQAARRAVPAVDYALGAAGVAAAGAIVSYLIGKEQASIIIVGGMFVGMVLLFTFARLVSSQNAATTYAGVVLIWADTLFSCAFLFLTASAITFGWPPAWRAVLLPSQDDPVPRKPAVPPIVISAVDFANGQNVAPSSGGAAASHGTGILLNAPPYSHRPNAAEWNVFASVGGKYRLDVEYAAAEARRVSVKVNGKEWRASALNAATCGWALDCQAWFNLGDLTLNTGNNIIRFERENMFPHIRTLKFTLQD